MKLEHIDRLSGGRKRFRDGTPRWSQRSSVRTSSGWPWGPATGPLWSLSVRGRWLSTRRSLAKARRQAAGVGKLSPLEHWREAVREAEDLVSGVRGNFDEDARRDLVAGDVVRRQADPVLHEAVVSADAEKHRAPSSTPRRCTARRG